MRTNVARERPRTHEGGPAKILTPLEELRRTVLSCLLWEDTFYESGKSIVDRIVELVGKNLASDVALVALEARQKHNLRHIPLLLARELTKSGYAVSDLLEAICQRPDELGEFLALYWKDGEIPKGKTRIPLAKQVKLGLGRALRNFDEYQLAKWDKKDAAVRIRDVLFMCRPKPKDDAQKALWQRLADDQLTPPDTWEVALSGGADKKATFERLMQEQKLPAFALIRNLRGMSEAGVDKTLIRAHLKNANVSRILPFRFVAAAQEAPDWEPELEELMFRSIGADWKLPGTTVIVVDCSGSMQGPLSGKSQMNRNDAACALAMMAREMSDSCAVYAYGDIELKLPPRRGFALRDVIRNAQVGWSTQLGRCVHTINASEKFDRLIVVTDEQAHDHVPDPNGRGYLINCATYQKGVGYRGRWVHIDGFSDATLKFIREYERL